MMINSRNILIILTSFLLSSYPTVQAQHIEVQSHLKKYYDQFNVEGTFVLYDQEADKYLVYNPALSDQAVTPASTFKICHSLIGLETGNIEDENHIIHWDSVERQLPIWNKDHDLKNAFKNSTVWYYQELAKTIGTLQMEDWLNKVQYGNANTSGGIDRFWLSGGLRITPKQQVDFLRRTHNYQLPFSKRSIDILKKIMVSNETADFVVRSKTGLGQQDNQNIGWYVGYIETKTNVYYFANCIQSKTIEYEHFINARTEIVDLILRELNLINE